MSNTRTIIARILLVLSPMIVIVLGYYLLFYFYLNMELENTLENIKTRREVREKNSAEKDSIEFDTIKNDYPKVKK
ncbi:hypothetical protein GWA97_01620 [Flavobacterium sp. LaA7.5]|nr:hypothetical protein [Flavobacterium salilacus subsp. altitudinum]